MTELHVIEILEGRLSSERVVGPGTRCLVTEVDFQRQTNSGSGWALEHEVWDISMGECVGKELLSS